ncbi:GNAT family N-acetyltransferase [uncultured Desulfuromusa sp.]|uniref:GNAT family N-acetyltransferase n=1 Tax=uncultured Desulfuromusa sp. TaxID=219183 RepID=UPI002AA94EE8|nr:GNAT family N-acetyltransferase [uncultured Desulfuromusa sp.]
MVIKSLKNDDWLIFHSWAKKEGWTISFQEQRLFQNQWRPSFFALWEQGHCCGFVSVVIYKTSGWIGNLLVHPSKRGNGYGSQLFDFAIGLLESNQSERIWLTASEQGEPLYRRRGFVPVDKIMRWVGSGTQQQSKQDKNVSSTALTQLIELDYQCWKESRRPLLAILADDGIILNEEKSLALLQPGPDFWQLGPWLTSQPDTQEARQLLDNVSKRVPEDTPVVMDIIESSGLDLLLRQYGFEATGQNKLMCKSRDSVDNLTGIIALASLGSIG